VDETSIPWQNRGHFFAVAARVMRRLVVDGYREAVPCVPSRGTESGRASVSARHGAAPASMPVAMTDAAARVENVGLGRERPGAELRTCKGSSVMNGAAKCGVHQEKRKLREKPASRDAHAPSAWRGC